MNCQEKKNILGVLVDAVDYSTVVSSIISAAQQHLQCTVSALAVHGVMTGVLDTEQRYRLNHLDLVCPDGQPVRWAMNLLHKTGLEDRVYGPELMLRVCEKAAENKLPIYLYGSTAHTLQALSLSLKEKYPELIIAGYEPSKFRQVSRQENEQLLKRIQTSGATLTLVGLGCPRQEVWIFEAREFLSMPLLAVGAAFDFNAGIKPQAPGFMQKAGMEWAFRLFQDPIRLWQRYILLNPLFLGMFLLQVLKLRNFDPAKAVKPDQQKLYG